MSDEVDQNPKLRQFLFHILIQGNFLTLIKQFFYNLNTIDIYISQ